MKREFYARLADESIAGELLSRETAKEILSSPAIDLFPLLNAAYEVRKHFTGKEVSVHIINNGQNGFCPEDCHYCAQAKSSQAEIQEYPLKSDEEFLAEAKNAYEKGAHRYCMVFAGRGPSTQRTEHLSRLIKEIKSHYPIEVCVSAGLLDDEKARMLKEAGLDRLNHNLNTSERNYPNICTTHTFQDRLKTIQAGRRAGIELCSGIILGMQEEISDILDVGYTLREIAAESIPVNFLIPIEGTKINTFGPKGAISVNTACPGGQAREQGRSVKKDTTLTPEYCLRVLCLFRFLNPRTELRIAAGRELHLRGLEVLALYPANSLFLDGYLNTKGGSRLKTLQMIKDAGFTIKSEIPLEELIDKEMEESNSVNEIQKDAVSQALLKNLRDLRPHLMCK